MNNMTTSATALCLVTDGTGVCTKPAGHDYGHYFRTMRYEVGIPPTATPTVDLVASAQQLRKEGPPAAHDCCYHVDLAFRLADALEASKAEVKRLDDMIAADVLFHHGGNVTPPADLLEAVQEIDRVPNNEGAYLKARATLARYGLIEL